jgi:transcriptional regulator with XRE-family HTH domain
MNTVERIKTICKERKIAISTLEKACGFANGYIGQLKKGSVPDDRLIKIADYLNVSRDFLMTGEEISITDDMVGEHIELISLYENLTQEQKDHVLNMMRLLNNSNK